MVITGKDGSVVAARPADPERSEFKPQQGREFILTEKE